MNEWMNLSLCNGSLSWTESCHNFSYVSFLWDFLEPALIFCNLPMFLFMLLNMIHAVTLAPACEALLGSGHNFWNFNIFFMVLCSSWPAFCHVLGVKRATCWLKAFGGFCRACCGLHTCLENWFTQSMCKPILFQLPTMLSYNTLILEDHLMIWHA